MKCRADMSSDLEVERTGFLDGFAVVSVAVVDLDNGREGERVDGLEVEAAGVVDAEGLVA